MDVDTLIVRCLFVLIFDIARLYTHDAWDAWNMLHHLCGGELFIARIVLAMVELNILIHIFECVIHLFILGI